MTATASTCFIRRSTSACRGRAPARASSPFTTRSRLDPGVGWRRRRRAARFRPGSITGAPRSRADRVITVQHVSRSDLVSRLGLPACECRVTAGRPIPAIHAAGRPTPTATRARRGTALIGLTCSMSAGWEEPKNVPFLVRGFAAAGPERGRRSCSQAVARGPAAPARAGRGRAASANGSACSAGSRTPTCPLSTPGARLRPTRATRGVRPPGLRGDGRRLPGARVAGDSTPRGDGRRRPDVRPGPPDELPGSCAERRRARLPAALAQRGRARSAEFSWSRTAEATLAVYHEAIYDERQAVPCASVTRS